MKKLYCDFCGKYRKFKNPKQYFQKNSSFISSKCKNEDEKTFKEEEWIEILKTENS